MSDKRANYNFGLDAELAAKEAAKFDPALENAVVSWIEALTGETSTGDMLEWLHDGTVLCKLMNVIKPGCIKKFSTSKMPFPQMENIKIALQAARKELDMRENDVFTTPDLFDGKSRVNVVNGLIAISRNAHKAGFSGPSIGPSEEKARPVSTKWEVGKATAAVSKLNMGSAATMDRTALDTSNSISFGADKSGASTGGTSKLNMGSLGVMEKGDFNATKDIDFGAKASSKK